jgi:glyoxylase-like metal-dependent hydrolase (beta-lactamase superfamily II)
MALIQELAPGFFRISLMGADYMNAYLLEDVLVDSGPRFAGRKLLSLLKGYPLTAHALTHAHFDHQGNSRLVCDSFGIPLWCGEGDRQAVETGELKSLSAPSRQNLSWMDRALAGPSHPVARSLHEGDLAGGFRVLEVPGHTPGSLAFWRGQDRILLIGDVLFHRNPITNRPGLMEPFASVTFDVARNRASARKLAALHPSLICFGHGQELRDPKLFLDFIASLPAV